MPFNEDLQSFIDFLKTNDDFNQTKKEYRRLIKLYHPDHASENEKDLYNEYILLINKVFASGKTNTKEPQIDETELCSSNNSTKTYIFTKTGPDGKTYSYKCRNYFDYLYKIARYEYNKGHEILHWHNINYLDKEAINQNSLEVMQHYWNAIKCYKFLLKNCTDPIILSTCEFELKMTQDSVNVLARTIANSDDKRLIEV